MKNPPHVWLSSVTFNDGTEIPLEPNERLLLIGPNNAGKSASLVGIFNWLQASGPTGPVIRSLTLGKKGTAEEVFEWASVAGWSHRNSDVSVHALGTSANADSVAHIWNRDTDHRLHFLCFYANGFVTW